jgi:glycosyltransferase involved in cell wall biosynthesis
MESQNENNIYETGLQNQKELFGIANMVFPATKLLTDAKIPFRYYAQKRPEILFISTYPPRECGIATYSQDLIKALNNQFSNSFSIRVCALESGNANFTYPPEVKYLLNTAREADFKKLAFKINRDNNIEVVMVQHEFGLFKLQEDAFLQFLNELSKPVVLVFHTVLPHPDKELKLKVKRIVETCKSIVVMTHNSANILSEDYGIAIAKISVIAHGTHLVPHLDKELQKNKYGLAGRKVITTFGLLSSGKSIETTLEAMPAIVKSSPEVVFLIIGKTHPEVVKSDGEKYREMLERKVQQLSLQDHVIFINKYLPLPELLEYLQLTDIYIFSTKDPNQAVSGTFAYAMSCACPIISTPIPHAKEVLTKDTGIIFDFGDSAQLAKGVNLLLKDEPLRMRVSINTLQKSASTVWENSAVSHAVILAETSGNRIPVRYNYPAINPNHLKQMTTSKGILQFSKINQPDIESGYTLDDNARALVATGMYFKQTGTDDSIEEIMKYLGFIRYCQQSEGDFKNYVDKKGRFTEQNNEVNLDDANGRAVWALGYIISLTGLLPGQIITKAETMLKKALVHMAKVNSTRAMAFAIKGLYYYQRSIKSPENLLLIRSFANRLVQMYRHESGKNWEWFEGYLTYANSILPESMLYAWLMTGDKTYKDIAVSSFSFLLSQTFNENGIEVISNKNWLLKGQESGHFGEQPIDVAYTIMTLSKFYDEFGDDGYLRKMETAFNWFLGSNRLHQIIYNPLTGGCYDGLEESNVNLNQGAESTVSYLMARLTMDVYKHASARSIQKVEENSFSGNIAWPVQNKKYVSKRRMHLVVKGRDTE